MAKFQLLICVLAVIVLIVGATILNTTIAYAVNYPCNIVCNACNDHTLRPCTCDGEPSTCLYCCVH